MMLDRHDTWRQKLELLLNFEPVAPSRHFDAVMKNRTKWVSLQRPTAQHRVHDANTLGARQLAYKFNLLPRQNYAGK